jgi:hypothetical protein
VVTLFGQVRSFNTTGMNGVYFSNGIFFGITGFGAMLRFFLGNEKTL